MKATPEATRLAILVAYQKHGTYKGTAAALSLTPKVVKKWIKRFQTSGSVAEAKKAGRKRALSTSASVKAHQLLLSNQYTGSDHVARELHKQGMTAAKPHKTTVIRAAREVAKGEGTTIRALRGRPSKQLSPVTMQKRLAFAKANKKRDWGRVLFTDRKKFHFSWPGEKVHSVTWVCKGGKREAAGPNRPDCLNVYCGLSRCGVTNFSHCGWHQQAEEPVLQPEGEGIQKHYQAGVQKCVGEDPAACWAEAVGGEGAQPLGAAAGQ
jgi:transposase